MTKFIYPLRSSNKPNTKLIGGKAASLATMAKHNIPLPKGFTVTTAAFKYFLAENKLDAKIAELAAVSSLEVALRRAEQLQKLIVASKIPLSLTSEIKQWVKSENTIKKFAVRSSANVEDAVKKSWAGQFDSYLNIPVTEITLALKKCWASIYSERVISYLPNIKQVLAIQMAVIVQESIESEVSGVCFTRDPLFSSNNNLIIEAVFGLGELLVGGESIPDRYRIERDSNIILEADVNEQKRQYVYLNKSGTKLQNTKNTFKQKLTGKEIIKLVAIALKIEKIFKQACDIEWCKKNNKLYIVQARPITVKNKFTHSI